jgi:hypothetical protein
MPRAAKRPTKQIGNSPAARAGGRPGRGRPKGSKNAKTLEIEALAKEYAGDALQALFDIATNGASEPARVSAATALLDRGYGKPRQAVEHSGEGGGPLLVTVTHRVIDPVAHVVTNGTKPRVVAR